MQLTHIVDIAAWGWIIGSTIAMLLTFGFLCWCAGVVVRQVIRDF